MTTEEDKQLENAKWRGSAYKNASDIYRRAADSLKRDHYRIVIRVQELSGVQHEFLVTLLDWYADPKLHQLGWEMFEKVISWEQPHFLGSVDSFIGNYLLDNSYFKIEWRALYLDGESMSEYLPGGRPRTILVTPEDPRGYPEVVRATDDFGSQDARLLLEAMAVALVRDKEREKQLEAFLAGDD